MDVTMFTYKYERLLAEQALVMQYTHKHSNLDHKQLHAHLKPMDQTASVIQDIIKHNFVEINIYTGSIST